jgi:hypothetical protein
MRPRPDFWTELAPEARAELPVHCALARSRRETSLPGKERTAHAAESGREQHEVVQAFYKPISRSLPSLGCREAE